MYISIIFVVSLFLVIDLKSADCAEVYSCYKLDLSSYKYWSETLSNVWCQNKCKDDSAKNRFYGTSFKRCICRETAPASSDKKKTNACTQQCPGNPQEMCGGERGSQTLMTVSEIASLGTDCFEYENEIPSYTGTTSVSQKGNTCLRWDSLHQHEHQYHMDSEQQNYCRNPGGFKILWCYTTYKKNGWERCDIPECEQSTGTMTVKNTQTAIRDSTLAEFMHMITSDTSPTIVTQSTPSSSRELSSTTSENANTAISTVMTKTSTHATTGMRPRKLLCKCQKRLINTKWHFLDGKNITDAEVKNMVLEDFNKNIKSEISVDKKSVSKEVRKKSSSVNKRKSSQSLGWGCIVFLILPMFFLIAIDILNCCIHFRTRLGSRKRNRIRPVSNILDQRESSKPLQENVNITESYYASRCGNNFHPDEMKLETYKRRRNDNNQESRDEWLQYI